MASKRVISAVLTLKDKDFATNAKKATSSTKDLERKVKNAGNTISNFGKNAVNNFNNITSSVVGTIAAFAGLASIGDIATDIVEAETAFDRLSAKAGILGDELNSLKDMSKEVFNAGFGDSISMVANDIGTLRAMFKDLNDTELANLAMGANTISELYGQSVNEVGKAVKTMTANFEGLSSSDALDLMTVSFQRTGDYAGDLLDTFNEYSGYFAQMGMDAEQFTNMLIKGSEAGAFNLDKVGDAVKEFGIRSIDGSKTTLEGFEAIGLNADDMASKIAQGGETAQQAFMATVAGLASIENEVARNQAGVALFGTQWEDLRGDVVLAMTDSSDALSEFKGATKQAEETMHKGFGSRMTSMWRGLKTSIAETFEDSGGPELLDTIATAAEGLVPVFNNVVSSIVEGAVWIKDNWSKISPILNGLLPVVGGLTAAFAAYKVGIIAVTAAQTIWKGVTTGVQVATALLNGTLAISPLGWVAAAIGGVVAAGVLLWQNWDFVMEKAGELWGVIQSVFGSIGGFIGGTFDGVKGAVGGSLNFIIDGINAVINGINSISLDVPDWVPGIGGQSIGFNIPNVPNFALGTSYFKGGLAQINERGGEIVDLPNGSRVYPHDKSVQMARTENNNSNFTININAVNKSTSEIVNELIPMLKLRLDNI